MKSSHSILALILFGVFGYLSANVLQVWYPIPLAIVLGLLGMSIIQGLLVRFNLASNVAESSTIVGQSIIWLIPFALLAFVADTTLGWQSAQAFFATGLSAIAVSIGNLLRQKGIQKRTTFIVPMAWATIGSLVWMFMGTLFM